jgi:hypothetical protein
VNCIYCHFYLQATSYLNKLPAQFQPDDLVLIADPMLATGGTMMQVRAVAGCSLCPCPVVGSFVDVGGVCVQCLDPRALFAMEDTIINWC